MLNSVLQKSVPFFLQGDAMEHEPSHKDLPVAAATTVVVAPSLGMKRSASDGSTDPKRQRTQTQVADPNWTLDKQHADAVINFLIRLACQVST